MKHLVKKYIRRTKVGEDVVDLINNAPIDEKAIAEISDAKMDGYYSFGITGDNEIVQTFKYVEGNKVFLIPEPDPIVIYFDTARNYHKTIQERREKLFEKLTTPGHNFYAVNGDFYWYYSVVCNYVIFLFLSLEAFINKIIPNDFEYRKEIQNKKTEIYDKYQIQRHIEFLEKIKNVIPQIINKNFVHEFSHKYELIKNLKSLETKLYILNPLKGKIIQIFTRNYIIEV